MTYKEQLNEFKSQDRLNHVEIAIALEVESYFENASDDEFESICNYIKRIYLKYGHAEISQLVYCFASLFGNGKSINEILEISSRNFIDEAYAHERGMEMMIRGVLIDVVNNVGNVVEIDRKLESYYKILNCKTIDITSRYIGDKLFDIVCDDEGLYKENFIVSAITRSLGPALVGNLFVVKHDGKGNERSLTKKEVEYVLERVKLVYCNLYEEGRIMLTEVETQKL